MIYKGKAIKYGSNIDTDAIIPARYLNTTDYKKLAMHCLEDLDKEFVKKVNKGDILVAGENFGCGSSREHAPIAIKESGIACVIAKSFARIFYRNAINVGLPVFECPEAVDNIETNQDVKVDSDKGIVIVKDVEYIFEKYPDYVEKIINAGGLMNLVKKEI